MIGEGIEKKKDGEMHYHVWFVTKYRKQVLESEIEEMLKAIFAEIAERKKYNILEVGMDSDHLHMLVEAEDRKKLSAMVRTLKAVSAKKIHESGYYRRKPVEPRGAFWARRYGWKEVLPRDISVVANYIRNQKRYHTRKRVEDGGKYDAKN